VNRIGSGDADARILREQDELVALDEQLLAGDALISAPRQAICQPNTERQSEDRPQNESPPDPRHPVLRRSPLCPRTAGRSFASLHGSLLERNGKLSGYKVGARPINALAA
jgi:hypothetical protein